MSYTQIHYRFLVLILICFLTFSCSSDDNELTAADGEFITANVETMFFETGTRPDDATAALIVTDQLTTLLVQGLDGNGNAIALIVPSYEGEGSYDLSFKEDSNGSGGTFIAGQMVFSSVGGDIGTGSLTVLSQNNEEITGRFEFVGVAVGDENDTRTVTNGNFRVLLDLQ